MKYWQFHRNNGVTKIGAIDDNKHQTVMMITVK